MPDVSAHLLFHLGRLSISDASYLGEANVDILFSELLRDLQKIKPSYAFTQIDGSDMKGWHAEIFHEL